MTNQNYWTHSSGCPRLFLAPMEGLGDGFFRRSYRLIGGFDEACTEFLRVPRNAHCESLARRYNASETTPYPLAAQVMGEDPELIAEMCRVLERRGAPRIDLNCGCPSNTVVGRGAGSSLLRTPERLHEIARAIVQAVSVPVSVKIRSGYEDTSLFKENLFAAQDAGVDFLILHPRTKREAYKLPIHWNLIEEAKNTLHIPVVGSGEVRNYADARRMWEETGCDGIMVGRGAIADPWIFHRIKAGWAGLSFEASWGETENYVRAFAAETKKDLGIRNQMGKLKQMINFMFDAEDPQRYDLLRTKSETPEQFLEEVIEVLRQKNCSEILFPL